MGRQAQIQTNFTAGEISPRLIGRADVARYKNGCKTLKNFKVLPHGGATKRAGTRFVREVKDSTKLARLIPFIYSTEQAYALEFGENSLRVFTNGAVLADGSRMPDSSFATGYGNWSRLKNAPGAISWSPGAVRLESGNSAGSSYAAMRYEVALPKVLQKITVNRNYTTTIYDALTLKIGTTEGASDLLNQNIATSGTNDYTFTPTTDRCYIELRAAATVANSTIVDILDVSVQTNAAGSVVELPTPWDDADLDAIKFAQSADTLYLVHPDYAPYKVLRYGATAFDIVPVTFTGGPFLDANTTSITVTPSATTGNITLTFSDTIFDTGNPSNYIGSLYQVTHGATVGIARITGVAAANQLNATVIVTLGNTTAVTTWAEGAWSGKRGYPSTIGFYEQRLWFGATAYRPAMFWGSVSGEYENMAAGANADDAVIYELSENQVNSIRWISPSRFMLVGTSDAEHRIGQEDTPITPTNIAARIQTAHGGADYQPVQIGEVTIFAQSSRRKVREMTYSFDDASYTAPDLTIFAEHITRPGIKHMAYQQEPDSIVWTYRDDGVLLGMTYERVQEVVGWHRHDTDGTFESVCSIPASDGDQVWVIVNRTINGTARRYIEYFEREYQDGDDIEDAFYVDCGIKYEGAATTTITGLSHLEGKTVSILANGAVHPSKVVTGGQITLDYAVTRAIVGLPYTAELETLPPSAPIAIGSGSARPKRWAEIWTRLYNTMGLKVNGKEIPFRSTEHDMDEPVPLYSGWVNVPNLGHDRDAVITYEHDYPTPCTIISQTGTLDVADE